MAVELVRRHIQVEPAYLNPVVQDGLAKLPGRAVNQNRPLDNARGVAMVLKNCSQRDRTGHAAQVPSTNATPFRLTAYL
ncbi:MAG TPA: hypothetical protein VD973_02955 [Symbiobacteriaceae bacterium]|nr:hypothetical protein [Symbiobacteriaceae bacterium]